MTWRRVAVYYILAAVLGGYFFMLERRTGGEATSPARTAAAASAARFVPIARDDIQELTLQRNEGTVTLQRQGQYWHVQSPPNAAVTSALVTSFVENLTTEKEVRVVMETATDLAAYGLARPYSTIVIRGKTPTEVVTVQIGDRNPTGSAVYARRDNTSQVVLVGYSVRSYADLIFEGAGLGKQ
jgi:hypothetical protein